MRYWNNVLSGTFETNSIVFLILCPCGAVPPPRQDQGRLSGQRRKRQRAITARPSDGEDGEEKGEEEDGTEDRERVKAMVSFQEVRWMNVPPDRGEADMEERQEGQRRTRALAALTGMSRVSKETKLRLRVIFLDDSERSFEVEVSQRQGIEVPLTKSSFTAAQKVEILHLASVWHVNDGFSSIYWCKILTKSKTAFVPILNFSLCYLSDLGLLDLLLYNH